MVQHHQATGWVLDLAQPGISHKVPNGGPCDTGEPIEALMGGAIKALPLAPVDP